MRGRWLVFGLLGALAAGGMAREAEPEATFWVERAAPPVDTTRAPRIRIGIWDSGVDTALFEDRLARDAQGAVLLRGYDAFKQRQDTAMAVLPEHLRGREAELGAILRAFDDRDSGLDSPEAQALAARMTQQTPEEAAAFDDAVGRWSGYVHGTGVADIAVAGNPHVEILVARMEWWHGDPPVPCWTRELADREAASIRDLLQFLVDHGARVVNMSWGRAERAYLGNLGACAPQMPEAERSALARYTVERIREVLQQGMAAAPQVLFVGAAGNFGKDLEAENPATRFSLPNFLMVGAVDRKGDATAWTNTGPEITLYANGDRVPARLPDGQLSFPSGTSMAVPGVVNAAARVLAVAPGLDGAELKTLLEQTATPNRTGQPLLHPANAVREACVRHPAACGD